MLLPNQQQKALFQLSVESAGGAKGKRRFQNRLFCMKKITTMQTFPSACLQLQQFPFGVHCRNIFVKILKLPVNNTVVQACLYCVTEVHLCKWQCRKRFKGFLIYYQQQVKLCIEILF